MSTKRNRSYTRPSAKGKGKAAPKKNPRTAWIAGAVAIVVVVGALVWLGNRNPIDNTVLEGLVQVYASEGENHVPIGERVTYRSNPPHSGAHYGTTTNPGFYRSQIPDEVIVHNLEHGHVILYYKPGALNGEEEAYITTLTKSHTATWAAFLAVPRPEMDSPLVLAAWRHLLPMETLDREVVEAFIDQFIGRGPENPVR